MFIEAFLHDAKEGRLGLLGQAAKFGRYFQLHADPAALGETLYVKAQGGGQTHLFEQGRVQQVSNVSDFIRTKLGQRKAFGDAFLSVPVQSSGLPQ